MCGIAGIVQIYGRPVSDLQRRLEVQSAALAHRGPDGSGIWMSPREDVGFCHRRLAIIDLSEQARQPMKAATIPWSPTMAKSTIIRAARGAGVMGFYPPPIPSAFSAPMLHRSLIEFRRFRGMFAFGLWDERIAALRRRSRPLRHQAVLLYGS